MANSLLTSHTLPPFSDIQVADIKPAITHLLAQGRAVQQQCLAEAEYCWDNLIAPLQEADDALNQVWSPVSHLNSVMNTPELRSVYQQCVEMISDYYTELGQNQVLYQVYQAIYDSPEFTQLSEAQQQTIRHALRDFTLAGVALPDKQKERFKAIQARLSQLTTQFENNVLDATDHWFYHTEDAQELAGLPEFITTAAQTKAQQKQLSGYCLGIDFPTYFAVMSQADNRELRERFYTAFNTRASDQGPDAGRFDNAEIMTEILALRHEKAQLLGMDNYAEYSLKPKMADTPEQVEQFLLALLKHAKSQGESEFSTLTDFAKQQGFSAMLQAWDVTYYSEQLKSQRFGLNVEDLRPYFPVEHVMQGMFAVIERIYGMHVTERQVDTWHQDVRFYDIHDVQGHYRGSFYADLYARSNKRGGAWMDDCRTRLRHQDGTLQHPVAYLICNFAPPSKSDEQAYITHDDVVTLFHEFGHALHHMLTQVEVAGVSGIHGVEWDAVELPSQFMEQFAWQQSVLEEMSCHRDTGACLSDELYQKLCQMRTFQGAMQMLRQLELALFDLYLHWHYNAQKPQPIQAVLNQVRDQVAVVKPPEFNRFQNSFSHIFAGGYAAGYYSYKWAEVLSSDAFSRFEEQGVFNPEVGRDFLHCILEQGGCASAMELFVAFRGREPEVAALLRHSGIT
jgi:oligopeptidase A